MRAVTVLLVLLGLAIGVAAVITGGADDSPGLQGIGLLIVSATLWFGVRRRRAS